MTDGALAKAAAGREATGDSFCSASDAERKLVIRRGSLLVLEPGWRHGNEHDVDIIESPARALPLR